ncbi:MAG TPA: TorF family putative porin [Brevundimonas sp.]|jgi:uncharacterized protein (TIGR02001 family)|uniref:TorF family putative porin n=1 Tax=Brevundimonas sp. TaxID=1871086 RepID=UPI002DEFF442|nr:TorF family putative porin [Brevundimonas sp.]
MTLRPLALALLASALAAPALAQDADPAPRGSWSFGAGVQSDNRSKQVSKSDGDPSVWALAEYASADGAFYFGPAVETVKSNGAEVEVSLIGGWRPQVWGFDVDLSAEHKWLVDAAMTDDAGAWEFTADLIRSIGPVEGKLRLQHTPDGVGSTEAWTWYEARASWDQSPRLSWSGGVGQREQEVGVDYVGWDVGATWQVTDRLELDARWHDTDADGPAVVGTEIYDGRFVVGLATYF